MLSYKRSQPLVKALCKKHGVPYVQENVFWRTKKTIDIMTGSASMRWFPEEYEKKFLERDAVMELEKKNKKTTLLSDKVMEAVLE
jgi:isocitrate dehydrogenase